MNIGYDCPCWGKRPPDWDEIDEPKPITTTQDFIDLAADLNFTNTQMQDYWERNTEEGDAAADTFILRHIERILSDWRKHMTPNSLKCVRKFEQSFDIDFNVLKEAYAI